MLDQAKWSLTTICHSAFVRHESMPPPISTLSLSLSLPPRPTSARSAKPNGQTSSTTISLGASPRIGKHAQFLRRQPEIRMASAVGVASALSSSTPVRPKRPLSASRVPSSPTPSPSGGDATQSFRARVRPASASQMRSTSPDRSTNDIETVPIAVSYLTSQYQGLFPVVGDLEEEAEPTSQKPPTKLSSIPAIPVSTDPVVAHAKFQAFLDMWEEEQPHFRSSVLFSETTFTQAKAMVSDWPRPNVLLAAIALGSLEQLGHSLEKQYPFLLGLIQEIGAAVYANFDELNHQLTESRQRNRFRVYFEQGRLWFQALAGEKKITHSLRASCATDRDEIERLNDALQEQRSARLVEKMQDRVKKATARSKPARKDEPNRLDAETICHSALPMLTHLLLHTGEDREAISDSLSIKDGSFQSFLREMVRIFSGLSNNQALVFLRALLDSASSDRDHKPLAEVLAIAVDALDEPARREFLREYFTFVANDELQDALLERDEKNDAKRLDEFVGELLDCMELDMTSENSTFHSPQARIAKTVLDRTELLQDLAAEFCFLDDETSARVLPDNLRQRLKEFETPARRMSKAQQLMASGTTPGLNSERSAVPECRCFCGGHRLVGIHERTMADDESQKLAERMQSEGENDERAKRRRSRRKSNTRRKNGINFGNALYSNRGSTSLRIFPLSEVCRLLTSIIHLQFSRDAVDEASGAMSLAVNSGAMGVSLLSTDDDRWGFLRRPPRPSFKTLARDFLVRKYGIKSIAVMHSLQLERSLTHYSALLGHARCELFAWFIGADRSPTRLASRDYAFRFFQRLLKTLLRLLGAKKPAASSSSSIPSANISLLAVSSPLTPPLTTSTPSSVRILSYSMQVAIWTESIGDGETGGANSSASSNAAEAKTLAPAMAIEACRSVFPKSMQEQSTFGALLERFYRAGLDKKPLELESFFRRVMDLWQTTFEAMLTNIDESIQEVNRLDFEGFSRTLEINGLELTSGERLELFDLLTGESGTFGNEDEGGDGAGGVVSKKKLVHFLLEAKYLQTT